MKTFGWTRPTRNETGEIDGSNASPVRVKTLNTLGPSFCADQGKKLVFTMREKDVIEVRPERTSRKLCITAQDLYGHLVRMGASRQHLEKARERKAKKAVRLARDRQERAERRLLRPLEKLDEFEAKSRQANHMVR